MNTNKKIVDAALKTAGHYIDVDANVLYITPGFNKKSQIYGTAECSRMNAILAAFPSMTVEVKTKDRRNSTITYAMMEDFIRIMPDAAVNYAEYKRVKKMSLAYRCAYRCRLIFILTDGRTSEGPSLNPQNVIFASKKDQILFSLFCFVQFFKKYPGFQN